MCPAKWSTSRGNDAQLVLIRGGVSVLSFTVGTASVSVGTHLSAIEVLPIDSKAVSVRGYRDRLSIETVPLKSRKARSTPSSRVSVLAQVIEISNANELWCWIRDVEDRYV